MLMLKASVKIYVYDQPVDMRKAIDGLSLLVAELLSTPLKANHLYLFHNRNGTKVKELLWDRNGFILHYKRLEKGEFKFPKEKVGGAYEISQEQLGWLLARLDFRLMEAYDELNDENYY